jgi:hypothetical protein
MWCFSLWRLNYFLNVCRYYIGSAAPALPRGCRIRLGSWARSDYSMPFGSICARHLKLQHSSFYVLSSHLA